MYPGTRKSLWFCFQVSVKQEEKKRRQANVLFGLIKDKHKHLFNQLKWNKANYPRFIRSLPVYNRERNVSNQRIPMKILRTHAILTLACCCINTLLNSWIFQSSQWSISSNYFTLNYVWCRCRVHIFFPIAKVAPIDSHRKTDRRSKEKTHLISLGIHNWSTLFRFRRRFHISFRFFSLIRNRVEFVIHSTLNPNHRYPTDFFFTKHSRIFVFHCLCDLVPLI